MTLMKRLTAFFALSLMLGSFAFADASPSPNVTPLPAASVVVGLANSVQAASTVSTDSLISAVSTVIQNFGGLSWALKIACIVLLIIAFMKVSFLSSFWAKLGSFQAYLAPVLGLILGALTLSVSGSVTLAGVLAYLAAGSGAILLHELLDTIKAIPGLGAVYVGIIDAIESVLNTGSTTVSSNSSGSSGSSGSTPSS
jgi:hypothetical protein